MEFNTLLKKIVGSSMGRGTFWIALLGLSLALLLILAAVQLRGNFAQLQGNKTKYVVINKTITNEMMGNVSKSTFTPKEITELQQCTYFDSLQPIKTSLCKVKLEIPIKSIPLNTDMYFQSVPDAYLDVQPKDWKWSPGDGAVKGIAPRFLVDMYNYGFAVGQQLPQLSEATIGSIPLDFTISNATDANTIKFKGNIGALSNRFFSILVPDNFMDYINKNYGFMEFKPPTGLVAKAKDPTSTAMLKYLNTKGLKTDYGMGRYSQYGFIISVIETMSKVNGFLFFGFALLVFMLFVQLTIVNAKTELQLLTTLGTSPTQLRKYLLGRIMPVFAITIGVILLILSVVQLLLSTSTQLKDAEIVLTPYIPFTVLIAALIMYGVLWAVNYYTIKLHVGKSISKA